MPTRRQFLKYGVAGALALAAAGIARSQPAYRAASGEEPLTVLGAEDRAVLVAIAPAMLAGAGMSAERRDAVVGSVDRAVAGLPPHLQREVLQLRALRSSAPRHGAWLCRSPRSSDTPGLVTNPSSPSLETLRLNI